VPGGTSARPIIDLFPRFRGDFSQPFLRLIRISGGQFAKLFLARPGMKNPGCGDE
jgi:hypothetical protein